MLTAMAPMSAGAAEAETLTPRRRKSPDHHVRFGVCGMSHDHIHGMIGAAERGGGELVAAWGLEPDKLAVFRKRYPGAKIAASQEEIIGDPSLQLILSSHIANERAGIGARAMKAGKDFLSDKPHRLHHFLEDLALRAPDDRPDRAHLRHHVFRAAGKCGRRCMPEN